MTYDYGLYCRPKLVRLMESIGLDAVYVRAEGNYLWRKHNEEEIKVLDLVGGYGANLLGHNNPEIIAEAQKILFEKKPIHAQASYRVGAGILAKALRERIGSYMVIQTNSGAETIEAAMKHALMERPGNKCWALKKAFHGKTLGAIQVTSSYCEPFSKLGFQVRFIDPDDPSSWAQAEAEADEVSAALIEPIRGEGGVLPLSPEFVQWLNAVTEQHNIPLIIDEVQTGMGRTGTFLANEQIGLRQDYICLSKSLGGGLAKIGVLLIDESRFIDDFSILHTSTFAEDEFSSLIAVKALNLLDKHNVVGQCKDLGAGFLDKLHKLQEEYSDVIADIRGKGLMIGIELSRQDAASSNLLRMISRGEQLGILASSYLLNVHQIRAVTTLSNPFTLRIQPSVFIKGTDLVVFVKALREFCKAVRRQDAGHLIGFLTGRETEPIGDFRKPSSFLHDEPKGNRQVAFMGHLIEPSDLAIWDPSISHWEKDEFKALINRVSDVFQPMVYDKINVVSSTGETVHLSFIGLFLYSEQYEKALRSRNYKWILDKIEEAVKVARDEGCQVIGLGGFNSIVSNNCKNIKTEGITLTSGNSLTVGMGVEALKEAAMQSNIDLKQASLGLIGAKGNIAKVYTSMITPLVKRVVLVFRSKDDPGAERLHKELQERFPHVEIEDAYSVDDIRDCSLIVTASNSSKPLIFPEHIPNGMPKVICDISIPQDVSEEVEEQCDHVMVVQGGIVRLPLNQNFVIGGIPLEEGHIFACMAETLLMGLNKEEKFAGSYGNINAEGVKDAMELANEHGFKLGRIKKEKSL